MSIGTATTLDDFNRADASTLGPNWTNVTFGSPLSLAISSNRAVAPALEIVWMYWNPTTFGPDCEITMDVGGITSSDSSFALNARMQPSGVNMGLGYQVSWTASTVALGDMTLGVDTGAGITTLDSAPFSVYMPSGGTVALRCEGSTISGSLNDGSGWTELVSATDTTIPGAGHLGMMLDGHGSGYATGTTIADDEPPTPPGPIDIGRRLLTAPAAALHAIDINAGLYH